METLSKNFNYNGSSITFSKGDNVMVNATQMAKPFGKQPKHWLLNQSTKDFIKALSEVRNLTSADLVQVTYGNDGGTWMHEDVALEFARWLSPMFAIWCNDRIKELLTTGATSLVKPPVVPSAPSHAYELTSLDVSSATGRRHNIVLKDIRRNLANGRLDAADFALSTYMYGKHPYPCYRMTVSGCFDLACSMKPHNSRGMFALLKFRSLPQAKRPLLPSPHEAVCEHSLADTLVDACCGLKALRAKHQEIAADILSVEKRLKNMLF